MSKLAIYVSSIFGVMLAIMLMVLAVTDGVQVQQSRDGEGFIRIEEADCQTIERKREDVPIGVIKEYTFSISDTLATDSYLAFYMVHQCAEVWLDGQQVYSIKPSGERRITKTVGSNWAMLPIYREDAGKEVRVEITPAYESFRNRKVEFLIGSQLAIYKDRLSKDLPQIILSALAIFVGVLFICMAGISLFQSPLGRELANLGLFSLLMGIWRLTDTRFTPLFLPDRPVFLFYLSVATLMIGIIPLMYALKGKENRKSQRIFDGYCILVSLNGCMQILLQVTGVADIRENLFVIHIIAVIGVVLLIINAIVDQHKYSEKLLRLADSRLFLICFVGVLADLVAFYVRGTSSGLLFSLASLLLYVVFSGVGMLFRYSQQEKELAEKDRRLAEQERQLTDSRIATMVSQIQPHFIYNTLGTIGQFCLDEPEQAADLVQKFTMYLRGNFVELGNEAPISITKELEHVRYYADIEQIRFPDIQVQYDLKANEFMLPALTVQPLVENAIKHGLMGLETGGTVKLSTYETESDYCVRVEDDGVGFDASSLEKGRKHVGIQNVRVRLEAMCGGALNIESVPNKGTTAVITIPKEEN